MRGGGARMVNSEASGGQADTRSKQALERREAKQEGKEARQQRNTYLFLVAELRVLLLLLRQRRLGQTQQVLRRLLACAGRQANSSGSAQDSRRKMNTRVTN